MKIKTITIILDEDMFHHLAWTTPPKLALGKEVWPKGGKKEGGWVGGWKGAMPKSLNLDFL